MPDADPSHQSRGPSLTQRAEDRLRVLPRFGLAPLLATMMVLITPRESSAQRSASGAWTLTTGYASFRDELNVGLLYHGGRIQGQYLRRYVLDKNEATWATRLAIDVSGSHGMVAIDLDMSPLEAGYLFRVVDTDRQVWIGPGVSANWNWYVNPLLHSGSFFWFTHYDLEFRAATSFHVATHRFRIGLHAPVASLASRPVPDPDPYFYDWGVKDLLADAHGNLTFGSIDLVRAVFVDVDWTIPGTKGNLALVYQLKYTAYRKHPTMETLYHLVSIRWN